MTWPLLAMFDTGDHGHIGYACAVADLIAAGQRSPYRPPTYSQVAAWSRRATAKPGRPASAVSTAARGTSTLTRRAAGRSGAGYG